MAEGCEAVARLTHPAIRVVHDSGVVLKRRVTGFINKSASDNVFIYNNTLTVVMRALTERLYYVESKDGFVPCPQPLPNIYNSLDNLKTSLLRSLPWTPSPMTTEQFLGSYEGSKRKRYESAVALYRRTGMRRTYGFIGTFIKGEFYNGTKKNNPCPRLIQPRHPVYNYRVGLYIRPAEKCLYKALDNLFGHHAILKCDSPWERAATISSYWGEFNHPAFKGFDAKRFDQHTSPPALRFEHSIYNALFRSRELRELLEWQIDNTGYFNSKSGSIRYDVQGCRMSGDMNTALGNVLLMSLITKHYLDSLGVKYRFIDDGDDCGVFMEEEHIHLLEGLPDHHLQFGYEMAVEDTATRIEEVEFCQSRPVYLGEGRYTMVRNPIKAMKQDLLFIDRDWASVYDVAHATGVCGIALYEGIPVLGEFYAMMARTKAADRAVRRLLSEMGGIVYVAKHAKAANRPSCTEPDEARVSFYHAFGILPDLQVALESEFRAVTDLSEIKTVLHLLHPSPENKINYYIDG